MKPMRSFAGKGDFRRRVRYAHPTAAATTVKESPLSLADAAQGY